MLRIAWILALAAACVPNSPASDDAGSGPDSGAIAEDATTTDADPYPDAMIEDAGSVDTGQDAGFDASFDAGLPSHCPTSSTATCASAMQCEDDIPPPTNCDACVPSNLALCADASCEMPPTLASTDLYVLAVQVNPVLPDLESIGAFAVAERTAGELLIDCADVYTGEVDLTDRCYNVLESRGHAVGQSGDTYTISFGNFASGQRTLFIMYGFTQTQARGDPVGVSCTEVDVGPPTGGQPQFFAGEPMRPL